MNHQNNPAGRLFLILKAVKSLPKEMTHGQAWPRVLDLPQGSSHFQVLKAVATFFMLPGQAADEIKALVAPPVPHDFLLRWVPRIENASTHYAWHGNVHQFQMDLEPDVLQCIELASTILSPLSREALISADQIGKLRQEAEELLGDVESAAIDAELKSFLTEHLCEFLHAINSFKYRGSPGLREAIGHLGTDNRRHTIKPRSPLESSVLERFKSYARDVVLILQLVNSSWMLGENVVKLLPPAAEQVVPAAPGTYGSAPEIELPDASETELPDGTLKV